MTKLGSKVWFRIAVYTVILIALSIGLYYLMQFLMAHFDTSIEKFASTAYWIVFASTLICNATILVPVPVATATMIAAASIWDPIRIAFIASIAGTLGEITGYYAGYLGKKIAIVENTPGYNRVVTWMKRYGASAIFLVALQPVLPVDIAGLTAGASKIPLWKFLLPCWAGKFPKYILFCYFGLGIFHFFPLWP